MAKVLTAIVHFSPSQVKQILAKEEEREKQSSVSCFDFLGLVFFVESEQYYLNMFYIKKEEVEESIERKEIN